MKFVALVPQRESNIQTILGDVLKLPEIAAGVSILHGLIEAEHHVDLPIDFDKIYMEDDGGLLYSDPASDLAFQFQYTRHALSQAVVRIKPEGVVGMAGYLAVCPPDLRAANFNFWHNERYGPDVKILTKNDVLLRTRAGESEAAIVRAVVSQSYVPIDDLPLLKNFLEIVPAGAKMRSARGDTKSRYDVIWPTMKRTLVNGEPLMVAVRLSNSEAGTSSISLDPIVHSMGFHASIIVPTNRSEVSIRHIGEAGNRLSKRLDTVLEAIEPFIDMLDESYEDTIIGHFNTPEELHNALKKEFELNESTLKRVQDSMYKKDTRADVIEALARAATELPIEDGEHLQRCAGLLAMKGWKILTRHIAAVE